MTIHPDRDAPTTMHVLTLIADRKAAPLTGALVGRVRDAIGGSITVDVLSRGEALDLTVHAAPDLQAVRAALDGAPVDAIAQRVEGRRKRLLIADMDSTIVTAETLDE